MHALSTLCWLAIFPQIYSLAAPFQVGGQRTTPSAVHQVMGDDVGACECDVLVLGAGAAGIGAARTLLKESNGKLQVVVLEARDRIGGRAWASDELKCGVQLDHGGRWVHGSTSQDPPNPMTELAREHQIPTTIWDDHLAETGRRINITRVLMPKQSNGETIMQSSEPHEEAGRAAKLLYEQLCSGGHPLKHDLSADASYKDGIIELANREMPGKPFQEWLEAKVRSALRNASHPDEISDQLVRETIALLRHRIYYWMENYEGCRLDQCSLRHAYDGDILPGPNAHVTGGYGKLIETLASSTEMDIRCGLRVKSVDRSNPDGVEVVCTRNDGSESEKRFIARRGCIVALPLGVLQRRDPAFVPPLPERLTKAIDGLGMCLMDKIELLFPNKWWPGDTGTLNIASESDKDFPLGNMPWSHWIVEGDDPPILVCYATGVFAERIETMSNEDIQTEAMEALRSAFLDEKEGGVRCIPDALRIHVTRWRSDPFARGSWTYFKAGTRGAKDVRAFGKYNSKTGHSDRTYFCGEHTCDGSPGLDIGTIHGAYSSGKLAAEELLANTNVRF